MNPYDQQLAEISKRLTAFSVVVEPGACDGQQTKVWSEMCPKGVVHAIEPDPRNIKNLVKRKLANVVIHEGAFSNFTGRTSFTPSNTIGSGSVREPTDKLHANYPHLKFGKPIKVRCWTYDDFCREQNIQEVALLWADVQGCEKDIFTGGQEMLRKTRLVNFEVSECGGVYEGSWSVAEMYEKMGDIGFVCIGQFGPDVLWERIG